MLSALGVSSQVWKIPENTELKDHSAVFEKIHILKTESQTIWLFLNEMKPCPDSFLLTLSLLTSLGVQSCSSHMEICPILTCIWVSSLWAVSHSKL